jgi:hypothetical protein
MALQVCFFRRRKESRLILSDYSLFILTICERSAEENVWSNGDNITEEKQHNHTVIIPKLSLPLYIYQVSFFVSTSLGTNRLTRFVQAICHTDVSEKLPHQYGEQTLTFINGNQAISTHKSRTLLIGV